MSGRMISFKLSPELLGKIDYAAERDGCSVGGLVIKVLGDEGPSPEDREEFRRLTRRFRVMGPFTAKLSFRVPPETARKLRVLGGRRLSLGQVARFLFAFLLPARPAEGTLRAASAG